MKHYPGTDLQELVEALPIDGVWRLLYSMPVEVGPGDIVQPAAEFEVTNDAGRPVGVFSIIKLQATPATFSGGWEVTEANGRNVTPDMHHDTHARVGSLTVPPSWPTGGWSYVNLWVRAVQTQSGLPPLTVERDFGRMFVNVFEAAPA